MAWRQIASDAEGLRRHRTGTALVRVRRYPLSRYVKRRVAKARALRAAHARLVYARLVCDDLA